jgi:hypothetical protein
MEIAGERGERSDGRGVTTGRYSHEVFGRPAIDASGVRVDGFEDGRRRAAAIRAGKGGHFRTDAGWRISVFRRPPNTSRCRNTVTRSTKRSDESSG